MGTVHHLPMVAKPNQRRKKNINPSNPIIENIIPDIAMFFFVDLKPIIPKIIPIIDR